MVFISSKKRARGRNLYAQTGIPCRTRSAPPHEYVRSTKALKIISRCPSNSGSERFNPRFEMLSDSDLVCRREEPHVWQENVRPVWTRS